MGKRQLQSPDDFRRAIRNGYGVGTGINYKAWIGIRDVPSRGRSSLIHGLTVLREHQMISDLETETFYGLDWNPNVVDIREQFPILPRDVAIGIAKRYGISYPNIPKTNEPAVLTTDFLATVAQKSTEFHVAVECKYASDLLKQRELEKLEIKRLFWAAMGCSQMIVTEKSVDPIVAENLNFISAPLRGALAPSYVASDLPSIVDAIPTRVITIDAIVNQICVIENVESHVARQILFQLIWHHCLKIDMSVSIEETGLISVTGWDTQAYRVTQAGINANSA